MCEAPVPSLSPTLRLNIILEKRKMRFIVVVRLVRLGFVDKLADQIRARGMSVEIFDSVEPDPTIETARLGVQVHFLNI
jgi:alcohol dehydrogenase class IV